MRKSDPVVPTDEMRGARQGRREEKNRAIEEGVGRGKVREKKRAPDALDLSFGLTCPKSKDGISVDRGRSPLLMRGVCLHKFIH